MISAFLVLPVRHPLTKGVLYLEQNGEGTC
jgi:hypothetical protein